MTKAPTKTPTKTLRNALICTALLPALAAAAPVDEENAKLRVQVEQLKAQLQAAQSSCAAANPAPAANVVVAPAPSAGVVAPPAASPSAPTVATQAQTPATPAIAPTAKAEVPSGYKLVKIEPVIPVDNRWKDVSAWESLFKGMSKQDVEGLLGVEHSVTEGSNRTFWGYGKIGVNYSGKVIFVDNRLAVWTKPDF